MSAQPGRPLCIGLSSPAGQSPGNTPGRGQALSVPQINPLAEGTPSHAPLPSANQGPKLTISGLRMVVLSPIWECSWRLPGMPAIHLGFLEPFASLPLGQRGLQAEVLSRGGLQQIEPLGKKWGGKGESNPCPFRHSAGSWSERLQERNKVPQGN